jgi:hypothetical protein
MRPLRGRSYPISRRNRCRGRSAHLCQSLGKGPAFPRLPSRREQLFDFLDHVVPADRLGRPVRECGSRRHCVRPTHLVAIDGTTQQTILAEGIPPTDDQDRSTCNDQKNEAPGDQAKIQVIAAVGNDGRLLYGCRRRRRGECRLFILRDRGGSNSYWRRAGRKRIGRLRPARRNGPVTSRRWFGSLRRRLDLWLNGWRRRWCRHRLLFVARLLDELGTGIHGLRLGQLRCLTPLVGGRRRGRLLAWRRRDDLRPDTSICAATCDLC